MITPPASEPTPPQSPATVNNTTRRATPLPSRQWRSRDIGRAATIVIALVAFIWLIWLAHPLIFTAFLGLLFGLAISAGADWLQRWRIPRGLGVSIVVVAFFAVMYGIAAWIGPTIRVQAKELRVKLPQAIDKGEIWLDSHRDGFAGFVYTEDSIATDTLPVEPIDSVAAVAPAGTPSAGPGQHQPGRLRGQMLGQVRGARRYLFPFFRSTLEVFAGFLLVLFIAIYIAAEPDMYRRGLLALVPLRSRARIDTVLTAEARSLRKWLTTQLIAMIAVGVARTIALLVLNVKAAFALGVVAAVFGFVPTIGPLVSGIPAVAMAFLDSPEKALYVALAYWAIQFVDAHLLIPLMMKGNVNLPPALTLFSQALMALLFGVLGLVVAVPLLAAVMVAVRMLYVEDVASKDTGQFPAAGAG